MFRLTVDKFIMDSINLKFENHSKNSTIYIQSDSIQNHRLSEIWYNLYLCILNSELQRKITRVAVKVQVEDVMNDSMMAFVLELL